MCSWCWGFAPVADQLRERFEATARFTLVLGGLRPGERAEPLDERLKRIIEPHWRRVEELTKQPFNYAFFEREGFLFDTEPPSRAVVAVRHIAPEQAFPFFRSLQQAFYTDDVDITRAENYAPMLATHGIAQDAFMDLFEDSAVRQETYADFDTARQLGAQGFPTVILRKGEDVTSLTVGYQPYASLLPVVERYFALEGAAC